MLLNFYIVFRPCNIKSIQRSHVKIIIDKRVAYSFAVLHRAQWTKKIMWIAKLKTKSWFWTS